jgi:hypothetical protein
MTPLRSPAHLRFVRSLPCCVPRCSKSRIEAAHVGSRGMGVKCPDTETAPLCQMHHREQHRIGKRAFEDKYGISFRDIIARLTQKPRIQIIEGHYVATLEGFPLETYRAGPLEIGRKEAIRRSVEFFREQYIDMVRGRKPSGSALSVCRRTGVSAASGEWPWLV